MRVYHLVHAKWALEDLERRRIKVAEFGDLNDPFELLSVELSDMALRTRFNRWRKGAAAAYGMLCFSSTWRNPVLWSHYGDRHSGICLGFDVPTELLQEVQYLPKRLPLAKLIDTRAAVDETVGPLFWTKFVHWKYEAEVRRIIRLGDAVKDGTRYFWPFGKDLELREIVAGARCDIDEIRLKRSLGGLADRVDLRKARPAFRSFGVVIQQRGFARKGTTQIKRMLRSGGRP